MIRMGRSSKTEPISEAPPLQETYTTPTTNVFNSSPSTTRAMSESESMARDIKEGRLSGFVGNGTVLTGETNFQAMLRVDGHLTGRVSSESGTLIIGSTGRVDANILVAAAMINGTVNGDIVAAEKVELGRSARVIGNIQTPRIVIEDGAIFEGSCTMLKAKEAHDKKAFESRGGFETNDLVPLEIHTGSITDEDGDEVAEAANS
ncbi:MAG: polymer-forming cytoskeletal protein [Pyrinomonadaceae bacterium]|nr:polymer-forming cytoskeletal protein [Pyrinomonadaceae bacterium]